MSGIVIAFPGNWAGADRGPKVKKVRPGSRKRPPQIEARVERINVLLAELEELTPCSGEVSTALNRARVTISKVEERLASLGFARSAPAAIEDEGDAQPHVDREVLERHFQTTDQ